MDVHAALEEVAHWCALRTAAGEPDRIEVECRATVWITIGESAPPWRVRWERRCSAGASSPVAQLRYDLNGWVDTDRFVGEVTSDRWPAQLFGDQLPKISTLVASMHWTLIEFREELLATSDQPGDGRSA